MQWLWQNQSQTTQIHCLTRLWMLKSLLPKLLLMLNKHLHKHHQLMVRILLLNSLTCHLNLHCGYHLMYALKVIPQYQVNHVKCLNQKRRVQHKVTQIKTKMQPFQHKKLHNQHQLLLQLMISPNHSRKCLAWQLMKLSALMVLKMPVSQMERPYWVNHAKT